MKTLAWAAAVAGVALTILFPPAEAPAASAQEAAYRGGAATEHAPAHLPIAPPDDGVVDTYCVRCHSDRRLTGNLSLESFDPARPMDDWPTAEKMIRKLRAGMMPPPGSRRPGGDSLLTLVTGLEERIDARALAEPDPGTRPFQRLNRAEYEASVRALLGLEIDAADYLPLDTKSANFDNIADVQMMSATTMSAYMSAAAEIARLAVGDPDASPVSTTYANTGYTTQWDRIEGAPRGTRGGISVVHTFPADGEYVFTMSFEHTTTGGFYGRVTGGEEIEVSIDGERVALHAVDRWMSVSDPNGVNMKTDPVFVTAGPHRVTAAFLKLDEGPVEDLLSPHDWSLADRQIGVSGYGVTALAHLKNLVVDGPYDPVGVSGTPSRARIFSCYPEGAAVGERPVASNAPEARACAREIVERLAPRAFRRPVEAREVEGLLALYDEGTAEGGFEAGVRTALQAILASPDFVFRFEERTREVAPGEPYPIADVDLASRLSYFLWGGPPDDELVAVADAGRLSDPEVLEAQLGRMVADPRSEALATRFAAQWLRLDDLDKVHPDRLLFPDYHQQLADAMRRETELFFHSLVTDDRSLLDLYSADYTFVNERLARHYGIEGVTGEHFRRVAYPGDHRRGIFGHGSVLTLTSHANRTSPVLRGKWVMEVLLGTPPPPPPPGVPDLEETEGTLDGRVLTTRERMEEHRSNPSCNSCHRFIDPIGLALDNYDVTGRWRIREHGMPLDTQGEMYDGTPVETPSDLRDALLARPIPLVRTFTENLMAYATGRRMEYFDQPTIRAITRRAAEEDYRMSAFLMGVVESPAFRMSRAPVAAPDEPASTPDPGPVR